MELRIINIPEECAGHKHITEALRTNYEFLRDANIDEIDIYVVKKFNGETYTNARVKLVYNSDFKKRIFKVKFGLHESRVYEAYDVLQCRRCCRIGHSYENCGERQRCKQCNGFHTAKFCTENHRECINCIEANKRHIETGEEVKLLRTDHCATYHGCRTRKRYGMKIH